MNIIDLLWDKYPYEFSKKRVIVKDRDTMYNVINRYNGKIDCYISVYTKSEFPIIDKLFFDLDSKDSWEKVKLFHNKMVELDFRHCIIFSGGGFHIYMFTKSGDKLRYPKQALRDAQLEILNIVGLTQGASETADIDSHIIGDVSRITRIPHTFNVKPNRQRFCIVVQEFILKEFTYEQVKEYAKEQHVEIMDKYMWGSNFVDIKKFDSMPTLNMDIFNDSGAVLELQDDYAKALVNIPPLLRGLLLHTRCGWRDRYLTILGLKECGISKQNCIDICKHYWTEDKFKHALMEERQFEYIYNRQDLFFPKWTTIQMEGYHVGDADRKFKFYNK